MEPEDFKATQRDLRTAIHAKLNWGLWDSQGVFFSVKPRLNKKTKQIHLDSVCVSESLRYPYEQGHWCHIFKGEEAMIRGVSLYRQKALAKAYVLFVTYRVMVDIDPEHPVTKELWRKWTLLNFDVFLEVADRALANHDGVLSDMFAATNISQARALADLMNEYID